MNGAWVAIPHNDVSPSCLASPFFNETRQYSDSAGYCVFKVRAIEYAQICCHARVLPCPEQDTCTYICPGATGVDMYDCLTTVTGGASSSDRRVPAPGGQANTTPVVQMSCYDGEGYLFPNISRPLGPPPPRPNQQGILS